MTVTIHRGDCRNSLEFLVADKSVQTCVTSPPYFGLRDYGCAGQLGLESSVQEYVQNLVGVFRLVRECLRDDGTLWLNLGDSYAGSGRGGNPDAGTKQGTNKGSQSVGVCYGLSQKDAAVQRHARKHQLHGERLAGLKPGDLIGVPWRVALALQADGWYLRQDIIWHKPNPMPESVTSRCTKAHEYIFLLSKNRKYYFDAEAIKEPAVSAGQVVSLGAKSFAKGQARGANVAPSGNGLADTYTVKETRNKRSVWTITTKPFREAHFATFPPDLIEPCILAGSKPCDTVLDPFGGAGTTGLVAQRHGRDAILCELNPAYIEIAERRLA